MITKEMKKLHKAKVSKIEQVSKNSYYIEFETEEEFESNPGQYISILCDNLTLRRPFSICYHTGKNIGILFKEKGKGTKYIKNLEVDSMVDFIGPMGNGFNIQNKKSLLVGAGIGIAPIFYLQNKLETLGIDNLTLAGFMSVNEIPKCIKANEYITNDGSIGHKGSVLDYLEEYIEAFNPEIIYSCGPHVVLKEVSAIAKKYSIESQVAMEKVMACGIGVCRGCVVKVYKDGQTRNETVCKDGPVFKGDEVVWS